eukprot:5427605-Prymnesium_polylepis.2
MQQPSICEHGEHPKLGIRARIHQHTRAPHDVSRHAGGPSGNRCCLSCGVRAQVSRVPFAAIVPHTTAQPVA